MPFPGLDRVINIYTNEDLAIKSFQEDKAIENIKKLQLRRRFKRLFMDIKAELKAKQDKSESCLKVDILNLSAIGAYIYGPDKFSLGDQVVLILRLTPKQQELQLEGAVVWLPDRQIQPHLYPGIGVEFCNISSSTQEKIIEFIERNISFISTEE